jgi:hypothetical protein
MSLRCWRQRRGRDKDEWYVHVSRRSFVWWTSYCMYDSISFEVHVHRLCCRDGGSWSWFNDCIMTTTTTARETYVRSSKGTLSPIEQTKHVRVCTCVVLWLCRLVISSSMHPLHIMIRMTCMRLRRTFVRRNRLSMMTVSYVITRDETVGICRNIEPFQQCRTVSLRSGNSG